MPTSISYWLDRKIPIIKQKPKKNTEIWNCHKKIARRSWMDRRFLPFYWIMEGFLVMKERIFLHRNGRKSKKNKKIISRWKVAFRMKIILIILLLAVSASCFTFQIGWSSIHISIVQDRTCLQKAPVAWIIIRLVFLYLKPCPSTWQTKDEGIIAVQTNFELCLLFYISTCCLPWSAYMARITRFNPKLQK